MIFSTDLGFLHTYSIETVSTTPTPSGNSHISCSELNIPTAFLIFSYLRIKIMLILLGKKSWEQ
jgi:hypothetical protein